MHRRNEWASQIAVAVQVGAVRLCPPVITGVPELGSQLTLT